MNHGDRTLVIVLSMHRSGSSLFTSILREHGMSLGPFELLGANSGNPHGHFEAQPILDLSREVQTLACGFSEDVPGSPEVLARFLGSLGTWEDRTEVAEELVERGRELIRRLVESGPISGFKDPRTVLIWPFWRRVLEAFPDVRMVPVVLLRTPHEIAMSVFTRSRSAHSYRTCLDVTAVHLRRLAAIVDGWPEPVARVRFGGPHYEEELAQAVASCGLVWDAEKARRCFDAACVHHASALVAHDSQRLHDALGGADEAASVDPIRNLAIVEADAFARESLYRELAQRDHEQLDDLRRRTEDIQSTLMRADSLYRELTQRDREQIDDLRHRTEELQSTLMRAEETSRTYYDNWQEAHRSWQDGQGNCQEAHRSYQDAHRNWQEAHRSWQEAHRSWQEAHRSWQDAISQLDAARAEAAKYRGLWEETREQALGLNRQLDGVHGEVAHLQARLLRFDSHPVLGPILRSRRRVKSALNGLRTRDDVR